MKTKPSKIALLALTAVSSLALAQQAQPINKSRMTQTFKSPSGLTESCVAIAKFPMGDYKDKDAKDEASLCAINFYDNATALCPKTWSTSPGTMVNSFRNVNGKDLASSTAAAEASLCSKNTPMDKLAKYKQSMNQQDTSGTFSASSLMYYHFSRALGTTLTVPVAVYRSMDKNEHYKRVSAVANPPANASMNVAGWNHLKAAESNPAAYNQTADLFTSDKTQIYGAMLKDHGERYGVEINGTRASGWGKGQNYDFQKTPAFMALKTPGDLQAAISTGYQKAVLDPKMKIAFPAGVTPAQMVLWMNEVSEIAILDYIFSQQDRIGNIDYTWNWAYVDDNGDVKADKVEEAQYKSLPRTSMARIQPPAAIAAKHPILVQKTSIGDNDAGGLFQYANFSKSTGMLEGLAHMNKDTYQRIMKLAQDFKLRSENFKVFAQEMQLMNVNEANKRLNQAVGNTMLVADLLERSCRAGTLKLDLVTFKKAMKNDYTAAATNCDLEQ